MLLSGHIITVDVTMCTPESTSVKVDAAIRRRLFKVLAAEQVDVQAVMLAPQHEELLTAACARFGIPHSAREEVLASLVDTL